jgi:hypothetical protein
VAPPPGRGSHTPVWLAEHGFARPIESTVDVGISYASWVFPRRARDLDGARFLLIAPTPEIPRVGSALATEGTRWIVGCAGYRGDAAPLTLDGLRSFAETLVAPDLADLISGLQPVEPPRGQRFPASIRRHYERLAVFPGGLLVTADALSSFNPIYGQGMTIAALEALALRDELAAAGPDLHRRFFRHAARLIDVAWELAAGGDLALPVVPGRRPLRTRLVNAYVHRIGLAAARDAQVGVTFHACAEPARLTGGTHPPRHGGPRRDSRAPPRAAAAGLDRVITGGQRPDRG